MSVRGGFRGGGEQKEIYPTFPHCTRLTEKDFPCKLSKIVGRGGGGGGRINLCASRIYLVGDQLFFSTYPLKGSSTHQATM